MYDLINRHVARLLDSIKREGDIDPYVWMIQCLPNVDVSRDVKFQGVYRRYWQLNPARLSPDFCTAYFSLLEQSKHAPDRTTVEAVARALLRIPTHSNGRESLQFSFASKLVHMVRPRLPVYDSMVESFFFLPSSDTQKTVEDKLKNLLQSYSFLVDEYDRVLRNELLAPAIAAFRQRFRLDAQYSDEKVIDTLIWRFVGYLRKGAFRDKSVEYQ
jgi:hypothetical protein